MKAKEHAVFEKGECNNHHSGQTTPQEPSTGEPLSPIDLNKFPEGTRVLQVGPPLIIDIPDSYIEAFRNSKLGADRQLPCNNVEVDLATHRKVQSGFLIGK